MRCTRALVLATACLASAGWIHAGSISLAWDAVPGATGYRIYCGTAPGDYSRVVTVGRVEEATLAGLEDCRPHHLAVRALNASGESVEFSNEVRGWARPEIAAQPPIEAPQGSQFTLSIHGANFDPGAEVLLGGDAIPVDLDGLPLVRFESIAVLSCNEIQALVTIAPSPAGGRAMLVGELALGFEVRNPDSVYGVGSGRIEIVFDEIRADINRSDSSTRDRVDGKDLVWLAYAYGAGEGEPRYNADADLDGDGTVDGDDLAFLSTGFGGCWDGTAWSEAACR